jgi:hypothetical protein
MPTGSRRRAARAAVGALACLWLAASPGSAQAPVGLAQAPADAQVPRPFEPLRVQQGPGAVEIALWGRSYRFDAGPLPSAVVSQGTALFVERPRFRLRGPQGEREIAWQAPVVLEARPGLVRLRFVADAPGLRVEAETQVEYDGMVAVDLSLTAAERLAISGLRYELALAPDAMRFFSHHLAYDYQVANVDKVRMLEAAGDLPDRLALPFVPTLALGDRRVGVEWWSETNAHWKAAAGTRPFEVEPAPDAVRLRVTPIGAPVPLAPGAAWRDSFAFFVFPSRPPPERWRSVRVTFPNRVSGFAADVGTRFVFVAMQTNFHARNDGLPAAIDDEHQRQLRADLRRKAISYVPYGMLNLAPILHPRTMSSFEAWSADGKWWRLYPGYENPVIQRNRPELGLGAPYTYAVCAGRPDYYGWMLEENLAALRDERLDGLYFDHGGITRMCTRNPALRGRRGLESWEYRNVRSFYKRLYEQAKLSRPDALIVIHTHGSPKAVGAFADFHMFGEALNTAFSGGHPASAYTTRPELYTPDYLALPPGYLDAQLFPPVGGVASVIPQIKWAIDPKRRERARGFERAFLAWLLSNDAHAPLWVSEVDTADDVYRAVDRFGDIGAAAVQPWWSNEAAIRRPAALRATAWVRDGRALLVLANLGDARVAGRVELDLAALGVPGVRRVRDLERPEAKPITLEAADFAVVVPPRELRVMTLE